MRRLALFTVLLTACNGGGDSTAPPLPSVPAAALFTLTWTKPALNTDGTPLTDIASYRIAHGTTPTTLTQIVTVPGTQLTTSIAVAPGMRYATVSTVNSAGQASTPSSVVSADVR